MLSSPSHSTTAETTRSMAEKLQGVQHLQGAPVLIWPVARPTDRSARKLSSVSPDLCEAITPQVASCTRKHCESWWGRQLSAAATAVKAQIRPAWQSACKT